MHSIALAFVALVPQTEDAVAPIPYPALTNTRREVVNFNVEPVRPLAPASDGTLYALNTPGSHIVHHMDLGAAPEQMFQTVLNPVSIALWGNNRIVVAGAGTHALALHDRTTGDILNVLQLPSEPADLVIDQALNAAFVACQGANAVVRVNLNTFLVTGTYAVPAERPRFLSFDPGTNPTSTLDDRVYVASFISGNGSAPGAPLAPGGTVSIGDSYALPGFLIPLADEDLFEIDVNTTSTIVPVKKRVGTLLTAHGRHPNGTYWALNVDSINQSALQGEPALRGNFVRNQAWRGQLTNPASVATQAEQTDLDLGVGGAPYKAATAAAFPFGIAFEPAGAQRVFICSPLDDCVSIRNANGTIAGRIDLPAGSIPFDVELDSLFNALLLVHCAGPNQVLVIPLSNTSLVFPLDLGIDPTPAPIKRGREIWYDGHRSKNARSSCNSCHPGGKSDFLGWQISDGDTDRKDVMVTQSLLGIEDTFPYHWRGERALIDFNGAFVDLLGGASKLSEGAGSEFADFQAFVFSLQPHANPREELTRDVPLTADPVGTALNGTPLIGDARAGLSLFQSRSGFNGQTCAECHIPQSGSNGDFINEVGTEVVTAQVLETPHLRELTHKDQPVRTLTLGPVSLDVARSGFGTAHSGEAPNIVRFILGGAAFNLNVQESADVAAFVRRFDQGIAPAAHAARMFDMNNLANAATIQTVLMPQAASRWIDLVAFGSFNHPQPPFQPVVGRFLFNPTNNLFEGNDASFTTTFATLQAQAIAGTAQLAFLGVPPGSGFRFARDPDNDNFIDSSEIALGTLPFNPDTDGDGEPDEYESNNGGDPLNRNVQSNDITDPNGTVTLDFVSASLAKIEVRATEAVQLTATFGVLNGTQHLASSPVFARLHTLALQGLEPSSPAHAPGGASLNSFIAKVQLTDLSGRTRSLQIAPFTSGELIHPRVGAGGLTAAQSPLIVSSLSGTKVTSGASMTVTATAQLKQRYFDPAGINSTTVTGRIAVFQVLKETGFNTNLYAIDNSATTTLGAVVPRIDLVALNIATGVASFDHSIPAAVLPGNFLFAPVTTALSSGSTTFNFTVGGLVTGQRVRVRLVAVVDPRPASGFPNGVALETLGRLEFPPTPIDDRGLEFTR